MRKKLWICLALFLVIPGLLLTVSCTQKTVKSTEEPVAEQPEEQPTEAAAPAETEAEAPAEVAPDYEAEERAMMAARNQFLNEHIYFDFDKYNLTETAQATLQSKADWLKENPDIYITIEGHADERGTNEYNLALGDRRAESAKSFLVDLGIEPYRISTVSYGEERPLCYESNEECWSRNRRDQFVIN
jgi:peptidoglycan-associated lipoprotein